MNQKLNVKKGHFNLPKIALLTRTRKNEENNYDCIIGFAFKEMLLGLMISKNKIQRGLSMKKTSLGKIKTI